MMRAVLVLILPILVIGQGATLMAQSAAKAEYYFNLYTQTDANPKDYDASAFVRFAGKLEEKKGTKNDVAFLNYVFKKTHQKLLKNYEQYASFNELSSGTYNCLTGTALYALLLTDLGYTYKIIETNYHIFLVVNTADGKILFEATDPGNGFVTRQDAIESRLEKYNKNEVQASADKNYYLYSFKLFNEVSLDEMLGLLFYNQAIESYNEHQLPSAVANLDKAMSLYNSPRVQEFSKIVLLALAQSSLEASVKENCVKKIQHIRKQKMHAIANAEIVKP
jgi:hypothetical protein